MAFLKARPLVLQKNGNTWRLIDFSFKTEHEFNVEIYLKKNEQQTLLSTQRVGTNTQNVYDLGNQTEGSLIFVSKDDSGKLLDQVELLLEKEDSHQQYDQKREEILKHLLDLVKNEMDFPTGTDKEKENHTEQMKKATSDPKARKYVESKIRKTILTSGLVSSAETGRYTGLIYADLYGMGILQELDDDPEMGEIMVNAIAFPVFHSTVYYIKNNKKYLYHKTFRDLDELKRVFNNSISFSQREINTVENAIIEATRANRDRVTIIVPGASENWLLNIRKFNNFLPDFTNMKKYGTVTDDIDRFLRVCVAGKANIGIGGKMGTGKTTLISYLLSYSDPMERKVVIASVSELDVNRVLKGHDIALLTVDGTFTFDRLSRAALRTTADRIIIPESRGEEFKQVYEASLKTSGNMFTGHALNDYAFLDMCTDMYLSGTNGQGNFDLIKDKVAKSMDLIIIMRHVGNNIRMRSISEVVINPDTQKFEKMNLLYRWIFNEENPLEGYYEKTGNKISPQFRSKLNENGVPISRLKEF